MRLSKNFEKNEFDCPCQKCKKDMLPDPKLVTLLQILRDRIGKPIYISIGGGIRCSSYNDSVGGYRDSPHISGKAADIYIKGSSYIKLAKLAKEVGFNRIGLYPFSYSKFIHVDTVLKNPSESWIRDKNGSYFYYNLLETALKNIKTMLKDTYALNI